MAQKLNVPNCFILGSCNVDLSTLRKATQIPPSTALKPCKQKLYNNRKKIFNKETYSVNTGMRAQITEQTLDTYRGGGVIPAAIPRLLTNPKYSRAPASTAPATAMVNTHPPATTTPPAPNPIPSPKITLLLSWFP